MRSVVRRGVTSNTDDRRSCTPSGASCSGIADRLALSSSPPTAVSELHSPHSQDRAGRRTDDTDVFDPKTTTSKAPRPCTPMTDGTQDACDLNHDALVPEI